ncbi:MAG: hypothetical protein JNK65_04640, partial [Deltaproteobacteria bacterium]|nr:hypothetical protein [Deltaproteobacteria bacterium]
MTFTTGNSDSLLARLASNSLDSTPELSSTQRTIDQAIGSATHELTNWHALAAMATGSMFFRFGRMATLGLGSTLEAGTLMQAGVRTSSYLVGLSTEVAAFEGVSRLLARASGDISNPNLFRWSGAGGWSEGLRSSFVNFGFLKFMGHLGHGQNAIITNLTADLGMVGGHELAHHLGITPAQEGTFLERMVQAQITNLQMGFSMSLMGRLAPRLQAVERSMDLHMSTLAQPHAAQPHNSSTHFGPELATAGGPALSAIEGNGTRSRQPLLDASLMARVNLGDVFEPA